MKLPIVFLHAFPLNRTMWASQIEAVSEFCLPISYDVRGLGESDVGDGQYTIEGHVDDLLAVMEREKIDKAAIVGLSMGGYITLRALERHPDRFLAAVLADTKSEADTDEAKIKRATNAAAVKKTGVPAFADGFLKAALAEETFRNQPGVVSWVRSAVEKTSPIGLAGNLIAMAARTDTTASLTRIKIPTLILVGEKDATTPPAAFEKMHRSIANSEFHGIPRAGHLSNLENAEAFNERLASFLKRHV